jgi:pyruvate,water dikinase
MPVPPGFIVTAEAYFEFLQEAGLVKVIRELLKGLDSSDNKRLQQVASEIQERVSRSEIPAGIAEEIRRHYKEMGGGLVAVRSSATAEDLPEASFAGQQSTFLNVQGEKDVVEAVQGCWASLFEPRAIFYREQQGFDHLQIGIAVPVQKMVQANVSGVLFTVEPLTSDRNKILIEAIFGLGEAIVSGEVTPDQYIVDTREFKITSKTIRRQEWQLRLNRRNQGVGGETNIRVSVKGARQRLQKLSDVDILALAQLGKRIEKHYQFPQDIEWAKEDDHLYILQSRPITTLDKASGIEDLPEIEVEPFVQGIAASPGIAAGPVKNVSDASQIGKVAKGDVLVARMTTPDFVPAMKRAVAIVTDEGGRTAHAAIVSRELGIPCVVGTGQATQLLSNGKWVTVDGSRGKVYDGKVLDKDYIFTTSIPGERIETKTKVYVNLAEPELAEIVAAHHVDGVGLLRAEFMVAQIGEHPLYIIKQGRRKQFVDQLTLGLHTFAKAFHPRPVVYRTSDFKTNEYRNLKGGEEYERIEENPMLGYRGCSRYIKELDAFRMEIEAIKKVREEYRNLWVMIPFVRTISEMVETKEVLEAEGLPRSADFKLWMMVEVPANIFLIEEFIDTGIDGISIGSNDLTQLILGIDRDNPQLAEKFDERNEAVLLAVEKAIKTAASKGVTASICGQAPSVYPEFTEQLVRWGITSVSVSPDMIDGTRRIIADVEARLAGSSFWEGTGEGSGNISGS